MEKPASAMPELTCKIGFSSCSREGWKMMKPPYQGDKKHKHDPDQESARARGSSGVPRKGYINKGEPCGLMGLV
jgi:hypothetical protein